MKRILLLAFIFAPFVANAQKATSQEVINQLLRNMRGGVEVVNINGRSSFHTYVGTGYKHYFRPSNAYLFPQADFKWGRYDVGNGYIETSSLAIPVLIGYELFAQDLIGLNVFTGGRYEQVLHSSHSTNAISNKINNTQVGVLGGANIRLANRFGITASYYYGLTPLFQDGTGRISSFSLAFTF